MKRALPVKTVEKYVKVIDLRKSGLTFEEIAKEVGYKNRSGAKEAFDAAIRYWGTESVKDLRVVENERIEELWRRTYDKLTQSGLQLHEELRIMETCLKITESKRKLHGLDAPRQLELSGKDGEEIKTDVGQVLKERLDALRDRYQAELVDVQQHQAPINQIVSTNSGVELHNSNGLQPDLSAQDDGFESQEDVSPVPDVKIHKGLVILREEIVENQAKRAANPRSSQREQAKTGDNRPIDSEKSLETSESCSETGKNNDKTGTDTGNGQRE